MEEQVSVFVFRFGVFFQLAIIAFRSSVLTTDNPCGQWTARTFWWFPIWQLFWMSARLIPANSRIGGGLTGCLLNWI
jgi:hypothetical protein